MKLFLESFIKFKRKAAVTAHFPLQFDRTTDDTGNNRGRHFVAAKIDGRQNQRAHSGHFHVGQPIAVSYGFVHGNK